MKLTLLKNHFPFLFIFILITSCNAQDKTTIPIDKVKQTKEYNPDLGNIPGQSDDPYFIVTNGKSFKTMPHVIIRNMIQDKSGDIWFATFAGVFRYDGKSFINFSDEIGIGGSRIFSVLEDRSGNIWFGTILRGICRYDGKSSSFFNEKNGFINNDVMCIFEDKSGKIWFGTNGGVSCYDGKNFTNYTTKDGLTHNSVYSISQDNTGKIWFGTQEGICYFDGRSFRELKYENGVAFYNVRAMKKDLSGNLWFGGQYGASQWDGKSLTNFTQKKNLKLLTNTSTGEGLNCNFVGSMIVDKTGKIWLGHPDRNYGGISIYNGKTLSSLTQKDGLPSNDIYAMLEDKSGNIWIATLHDGICRYDGKTFTYF
jgi:ligand-binding sensor domain-containing protein